MFTDGSVIKNETGCAFKYESVEMQSHLPKFTSIFTAELVAIQKAIEYAGRCHGW